MYALLKNPEDSEDKKCTNLWLTPLMNLWNELQRSGAQAGTGDHRRNSGTARWRPSLNGEGSSLVSRRRYANLPARIRHVPTRQDRKAYRSHEVSTVPASHRTQAKVPGRATPHAHSRDANTGNQSAANWGLVCRVDDLTAHPIDVNALMWDRYDAPAATCGTQQNQCDVQPACHANRIVGTELHADDEVGVFPKSASRMSFPVPPCKHDPLTGPPTQDASLQFRESRTPGYLPKIRARSPGIENVAML
jgi:hypothetical protein